MAVGKKPTKFVRLIDDLINQSEKTQRQIADEIGYDKPNIITMFKQGTTRVPAEKVPALALALDYDPAMLLRAWMEEYSPDLLTVIDANLGMSMSRTERSWVANLRKLYNGAVPPWDEMTEQALRPTVR